MSILLLFVIPRDSNGKRIESNKVQGRSSEKGHKYSDKKLDLEICVERESPEQS